MRILHVIPQFPYFGGRTIVGGHASSLLSLALAQAEVGEEVTILSYTEGQIQEKRIEDRISLHSLYRHAHPGTVSFGRRFTRDSVRWANVHRSSFDVVHVHSGFADYFLVSGKLKKSLRLPTLHTLYCPIPKTGGRWRLPLVHGMLKRHALKLDAVCAMSHNVADSLQAYGIEGASILAPSIDIARFHPVEDVETARRAFGLPLDNVIILFVGNAKPQKNLSGMLKAFRSVREQYPETRLVITTELKQSSSDEQLAGLALEMEELGVSSSVLQFGIVDDMPTLIQACDLLVAPFLDSFGPSDYFMAALEAMACGKPTIVSNVGGMPEVISDQVGRLVDPHDKVALASAITEFIQDPELRRETGIRARQYAEEHFDPASAVERYRNLYNKFI